MLPGVEFREFQQALIDAFDDAALAALVRYHLNKRLDTIVARGPLNVMTFELLEWAEREGSPAVVELASGAYLERPRNEKIRRIYEKFGMAPAVACQEAGAPMVDAPGKATAHSLEAIVSPRLKAVNMGVWHEKMARIAAQICRIEFNGDAMGTGFLIGPDLILTNYHVLEPIISGRVAASQAACRFDYKVLSDGSRAEGVVAPLDEASWRIDVSPYSRAEFENDPDRELPTADELDYALAKLARPVGHEPVGKSPGPGAPSRGWIAVPTAAQTFEVGQPLLIAQHPDGAPLKLALDTRGVIGVNANSTRVRYATNTEHGSSGAPCFDIDWNLVALHHMGDPAWKAPKYNQGVPIGAIRKRLTGKVELQDS
jgi:hypothetical protein